MPYDISAFRPDPALFSPRLIALHETFCRIAGGGGGGGDGAGFDRATCDFASPIHVAGMRAADQSNREAPYGVASAFNGAALYPLEQLRLTGVRYDTTDGSKGLCEHIPFHSQLRARTTAESGFSAQMYVSPKWAFLVSPHRPPGPTGPKFLKFVREQGGEGSLQIVAIAVVGTLCEVGAFPRPACTLAPRSHPRSRPHLHPRPCPHPRPRPRSRPHPRAHVHPPNPHPAPLEPLHLPPSLPPAPHPRRMYTLLHSRHHTRHPSPTRHPTPGTLRPPPSPQILVGLFVLRCAFSALGVGLSGADSKARASKIMSKVNKAAKASKAGKAL